ncbi:hypothetical protein OAB88_03560 [Winogradskyella sp.]|nr:hypothetical protein [Winogradskyella sp.]MDC1504006.1 hypothetical protein [Winogradskyella sp.]
MEPNGIEKYIKDVLKDKHIEPSAKARERLINALNTDVKQKRKPWFYYAVAAFLVLGLCFTGFQMFTKNLDIEQPIKVTIKEELPTSNDLEKRIKTPNSIEDTIENKTNRIELVVNNKQSQKSILASNEHVNRTLENSDNKTTANDVVNRIYEFEVKTSKDSLINVSRVAELLIETDAINNKLNKQFPYVTPKELLAVVEGDSTKGILKMTKKK